MAAVKGESTPVMPSLFAEGATAGGLIPAALPCWDHTSSWDPRWDPRFIAIATRRHDRGRIPLGTNECSYSFLQLGRTHVGTESANNTCSSGQKQTSPCVDGVHISGSAQVKLSKFKCSDEGLSKYD